MGTALPPVLHGAVAEAAWQAPVINPLRNSNSTRVAIIGAGLSGLHAARLLSLAGTDHIVLEGAQRIGGRILSECPDDGDPGSAYDMGPAWYWPAFQSRLPALVRELGLHAFPQFMDGALMWEESATTCTRFEAGAPMDGSMRIAGGLGMLINALAADGIGERVARGQRVTTMRIAGEVVELAAVDDEGRVTTHSASQVISTLPPRLLARTVEFDPALPAQVLASWASVPTWMAGQAKFIAVYERPFWREAGLSGEGRSRVGPMAEIHDASAAQGLPALSGFLGIPPAARAGAQQQVIDASVAQLVRLFGEEAASPVACLYTDWATDPLVATDDDATPLLAHPTYGTHAPPPEPWAARLHLAGTEATREQGGYMEGALVAAEAAVAAILPRG